MRIFITVACTLLCDICFFIYETTVTLISEAAVIKKSHELRHNNCRKRQNTF